MNNIGLKTPSDAFEHFLDKLVCPVAVSEQNIFCVVDAFIAGPTKYLVEMCKSLDARNDFNADLLTIIRYIL